jgi:hypothetical protein
MKKDLCLLAFNLIVFSAFSQVPSYDAASIPEKLKVGAHVIKRFEQVTFEVKDIDRAVSSIHRVYTILDAEGESELSFVAQTNKLVKIDEVDIRTYDELGLQTGRYKKKDLNKQANLDGLVVDGMFYYITIKALKYPVTVEYKYEINYSGTEHYPSYFIQNSDEGVQYSSFTASVPADLDLRYKEQKIAIQPGITNIGGIKTYKWEVKDLPACKYEEGSVGDQFYYPSVILAPNKFRHYNTYGDMSTWKSLGKWGYDLQEGLDELPQERKDFFVSLVKNATTDREKIALVYDYLQKNFRYVSIQLGIGGVKPFPANFTDQKKYGDCKGLSFYMYTALKTIGIKSYTAWINAEYNQEPVDPSFPCDRFNHVILCVPQVKDTIWLECTSNETEFAVLGGFTENRNALLLTENGGVLVATPKSKSSDNFLYSTTNINLFEDGSGVTKTVINSRGNYKSILSAIVKAKKDDQKVMIVRYLGFKQPDEFSVVKKSESDQLDVNIDLTIEKIPQFSAGSKMFLNPRVYNLWSSSLPKSEGRKQDYYFHSPFIRTDTTIYQLPMNYVPEANPKSVQLNCDYASYTTDYTYLKEKNQFVSVAKLELRKSRIPASRYDDVKKFFDSVNTDGTQKLIIKKN